MTSSAGLNRISKRDVPSSLGRIQNRVPTTTLSWLCSYRGNTRRIGSSRSRGGVIFGLLCVFYPLPSSPDSFHDRCDRVILNASHQTLDTLKRVFRGLPATMADLIALVGTTSQSLAKPTKRATKAQENMYLEAVNCTITLHFRWEVCYDSGGDKPPSVYPPTMNRSPSLRRMASDNASPNTIVAERTDPQGGRVFSRLSCFAV